jgi:hypothetical protein
VHDATGNVVARLADGTMAVGEHRLDLSGAGLEPGVYFCQVAGSQMSQTARLTVVR